MGVSADHTIGVRGVRTIDGYDLIAEIGRGSGATVYWAIDRRTGTDIALKRYDGDHVDRRRFDWEVEVMRRLSGRPHLLAVLAAGITTDGCPYLVSQLHRRGTLLDAVAAGGPLRSSELAAAGRQLCFALATLHANGVVHGDVKPENVFVADDDTLVLGDLGAASRRDEPGPARALTPAYAAPEVWLGATPTVAADLYALGATLLFAATGRTPVAGAPADPGAAAVALRDAATLLAGDPARRPASAAHAAQSFGPPVDDDPWVATLGLAEHRRDARRPWRASMAVATPTLTYR